MTNLEYSYITSELAYLVGKRFDKIYKVESGYRLKIADAQILIQPGVRLHKTKYLEETMEGDNFVKKVRAELANSRLQAIVQINNDRIIEFQFSNGSLIFEMFAKGNCILIREGITIAAMKNERWADREIRPKVEYIPPKPSVAADIKDAISDKYIITSLLRLPLGKQYSKEMLARCGIDEKCPGTKLTGKQLAAIEAEIEKLQEEKKPYLFLQAGKPIEFGLASFSELADSDQESPETLSEAIDRFYFENKDLGEPEQLSKLNRRLTSQQERLEVLKQEEHDLKEKGDFIYAHYEEIESILSDSSQIPLEKLEAHLKKYKAKVNKKEKSIELEL
jgi:predicted ribosome quality control (RQC) complex YloA/Tae2 family protein